MRNLFLILVLVNLGFAAWYLWIVEPVTDVRVTQNSSVPSISLVSELENSADEPPDGVMVLPAEAPGAPLAVEPVLPVARCVGVGPFSEFGRFVQALARLRSSGYAPTQRSEDGDVWLGHWVHLADITSRGQAAEIIRTLAERGIVDTAFDPTGAWGAVLSLGVFRELNRAEAVRERVQALGLGFEPAIMDRTRPGTLYWADLTLAAVEDPDLEPLQPAGRIIRLEQRDCDEPGDTL